MTSLDSDPAVGDDAAMVQAADDPAWVRAAQQGDAAAFERLIARYRPQLLRLVRVMVASDSDAEEVIQDALVSAYRALSRANFTFEQPHSVRAWLFRIAVNAALMHLRHLRRRPTLSLEELPSLGEGEGAPGFRRDALWQRRPDEALLARERGKNLLAALDGLPDKYRLVLWLRDVEEATNEEVALTLGLTVPTVKARLHRARVAVRNTLDASAGQARKA